MWFIPDKDCDEPEPEPRQALQLVNSGAKSTGKDLTLVHASEDSITRNEGLNLTDVDSGTLGGNWEPWSKDMPIQCGICEYKGNLRDAPPFLCFNCCDAIRRLVWISEDQQVRAQHSEPVQDAERAVARRPKTAVLGKR